MHEFSANRPSRENDAIQGYLILNATGRNESHHDNEIRHYQGLFGIGGRERAAIIMTTILSMLALAIMLLSPASADAIERKRVVFASGKDFSTINAQIKGDESYEYILGAKAGQTMSVTFTPSNPRAYFNILAPGSDQAIFVGQNEAKPNTFEGVLPESGDYVIQVYLVRAAARRNEVAKYAIMIGIGGASGGATTSRGTTTNRDFADSLAGGPDLWMVAGVPAGDVLNMRKTPSTKSRVVMSFANGFTLRNKGCKMAGGQRWCRVERPDDPSVRGWVAGKYLREAGRDNGE